MNRYLRYALKAACHHTFDEKLRSRHCAVLVDGQRILGASFNDLKSHPVTEPYHRKFGRPGSTIHAEMASVINAPWNTDIAGKTVYVVRINARGKPMMSMPCDMCRMFLRDYGIKRAVFTIDSTDEGSIEF